MRHVWAGGLAAVFVAALAAMAAAQDGERKKPSLDLKGIILSVDAEGGKISIRRGGDGAWDHSLKLGAGVAVLIDGKEAKPSDLPAGAAVACRLSEDGETVLAIRAEGRTLGGVVKSVDAAGRTLTLAGGEDGDRICPLGEGVFLPDLKAGERVWLKLSVDGKRALAVSPGKGKEEGKKRRQGDEGAKKEGEGDREGGVKKEGDKKRQGEGDREGEVKKEGGKKPRGEGDREGEVKKEGDKKPRGEGDREGEVKKEGGKKPRGEGDREGEVKKEGDKKPRGEGDREGEVKKEGGKKPRGEGDREGEVKKEGGKKPGGEGDREGEVKKEGGKKREGGDREGGMKKDGEDRTEGGGKQGDRPKEEDDPE